VLGCSARARSFSIRLAVFVAAISCLPCSSSLALTKDYTLVLR
jgi:hypothetical protein